MGPSDLYVTVCKMTATPKFGGHMYCFVETPHDSLICKICARVPSGGPNPQPYRSRCCGCIFCKTCLEGLYFVKQDSAFCNACPVCHSETLTAIRDVKSYIKIGQLHIYCTNKKKGCEWQGELKDISSHLGNSDGCQFEEVKCFNKCGKLIERQYLTIHAETKCSRQTAGKYN